MTHLFQEKEEIQLFLSSKPLNQAHSQVFLILIDVIEMENVWVLDQLHYGDFTFDLKNFFHLFPKKRNEAMNIGASISFHFHVPSHHIFPLFSPSSSLPNDWEPHFLVCVCAAGSEMKKKKKKKDRCKRKAIG